LIELKKSYSFGLQTPILAFPQGGRRENLSPLGEIRKGVKIFITIILDSNSAN
jgi:hypothetical protein